MLVNWKLHKNWFLFTREWTMCVSGFLCDSQGFTLLCKKGARRRNTTHLHISWRLAPRTKDYFLAASHAGIALQGLPRLKAKDVADVKSGSRSSLSLLTMCVTLQSPFNFTFTNGQMWAARRNHTAVNLSHTWEKVTEHFAKCADLDLY